MTQAADKLVVRLTRWKRIRELSELTGLLAGFLYVTYSNIDDLSPLDLALLIALTAFIIGFFALTNHSLLSRRPLLTIDVRGIEVGYPFDLGLSPWTAIEHIGTRRRLFATLVSIQSSAIEGQLAIKPLWIRMASKMSTERPEGRGVIVHVPESMLPMSAEDIIAAMKRFHAQAAGGATADREDAP